jgi:hypothetical protein
MPLQGGAGLGAESARCLDYEIACGRSGKKEVRILLNLFF